jgi:hypothetical protein
MRPPEISLRNSSALAVLVGVVAVLSPLLHSVTDLMEWYQGGFSRTQLWLNYAAFLPMPWLLLGLHAVHRRDAGWLPLVGAVLHGIAFTYFAHTTLVALDEAVPTYESLWEKLGTTYTVYGGFMVVGGALFAIGALRARELPAVAIWLFASGLLLNLVLTVLPVPDIAQVLGTASRNAGLIGMGLAVLRSAREPRGA